MGLKKDEIEKAVADLVQKAIEGTGIELVEVEYVRERKMYLRIFIDKPGGIGIDDCELVSGKVGDLIDEKVPISENYSLEVSSPGIDRPLVKDKDFEARYGQKVDIDLSEPVDGKKQLTGVLVGHTGDTVTIKRIVKNRTENTPVEIDRKKIKTVRPHIDF